MLRTADQSALNVAATSSVHAIGKGARLLAKREKPRRVLRARQGFPMTSGVVRSQSACGDVVNKTLPAASSVKEIHFQSALLRRSPDAILTAGGLFADVRELHDVEKL